MQQRRDHASNHTSSSSNSSANGNFNNLSQRNETVAISNQSRKNNNQNVCVGKKTLLHRKSSNTSLHTASTSTNITSIESDHQRSNINVSEEGISSNIEINNPYGVIGGGNTERVIDRGGIKQICSKRGECERNLESKYSIIKRACHISI